jgi:polysaccharide export outer membrane protein
VRIVRAFRLPIIVAMTGLVLSGCMRTGGPVAVVQPQGDLDSMAYGQTYAPAPVAVADSSGGGAISALRSVFASSPRAAYALAPASAVSAAPVEAVRYDAAYHLDAGDRLRVVVYGQEGLTNTYADASGSITMPLIGIVPARGRTTSGLAGGIAAKLRNGFIREPSVAVEIEAYRPSSCSARSQPPGNIPMCPT